MKTKKFKVKVTTEVLVHACLDTLYYNHNVQKVKIVLKKNSNQDLETICSGRGKLKGRIKKDVAEVWVTGTDEEVLGWEQFFSDFASVPEFSLREYISWAKGHVKRRSSLG